MLKNLYLLGFLVLTVACATDSFFLPEGDTAAGRQVLEKYECHACHEVIGDNFPAPTTITPTYVTIGQYAQPKSKAQLFLSIVAPSHEFARPSPPPGVQASDENTKSGTGSRMTDFSAQMTVKELGDLITYLNELQAKAGQ